MTAITPEAAAKHVAALVGINVTAKKAMPTDLKGPQVLAMVDDEEKKLVCVIQFDFNAAGSLGAALSRIPAGSIQDLARKGGVLDENLEGNFHEIANVLTVLTTAAIGRRTILRGLKQGKAVTEPEAQGFISKAKNKTFMKFDVQGYPGGIAGFLM
jgi:hypothetical protein